MRVNQSTAVKAGKVLLVPYEARHVPKYHTWMQDPAIQEATASEPLTLQEEYENQRSWRASHDKLTFIVCEAPAGAASSAVVRAGVADAEERMRGDVNLFIYEDELADAVDARGMLRGEMDVMIADRGHWRKGFGRAAVEGLLVYARRNLDRILEEYGGDRASMAGLMAKIKEGNGGSRALFEGLGFRQRGGVNYFGEVVMVIAWRDVEELVDGWTATKGPRRRAYEEVRYERGEQAGPS
ncbi:hypothetical protein E4U42_001381 [Claviceps africana]|uniref:N-acetyltransferase domain-containing protein n=1 Tax=Claviceps africana TaxID=83212 RepID=A0A8K0JC52_9HYPO|nr:hypothetical protein E4U42_001381 [Claviceps africana]